MLVLSCDLGEVRGLFCKSAKARRNPLPQVASPAGRPRVGRASGLLRALRRVGRACGPHGRLVFLFSRN